MADNEAQPRGRKHKPKIRARDVRGAKYLRNVMKLLRPLRAHKDCSNRKLHYDEYVAYLLLYFFSPIVTSLRGLQQVSTLEKVQKELGLPRFSLGSFSEARNVFDPTLLEPVIAALLDEATDAGADPRLAALDVEATVVDSTMLRAMPKMLWAFWRSGNVHAAKAHIEYSLLKSAPTKATITTARRPDGHVLDETLCGGKLYVLDRGYADYSLMADILEAESSFVVRLQHNAVCKDAEERVLTAAARRRGIVSDRVVTLGSKTKPALREHRIRVVEVHVPSRKSGDTTVLLLATDRLDIDVELIADLYRYRWQVELFFRWFKTILGANRLLALSENGLTLVVYCGLIASLLLSVWTGRKPTKRTYEMFCLYFAGWAEEHELEAHIEALPPAIG